MYFRSHVSSFRSLIFFEFEMSFLALKPASESEVCYFENILFFIFEDENIFEFEIPVSDSFLMDVVDGLDNLSEDVPFLVNIRFVLNEVVEKISFGGMLEDEDVMRGWLRKLLILLITHEGHVLTVFVGGDDMGMAQGLQSQELVLEVF